jgi:hypothetical protein
MSDVAVTVQGDSYDERRVSHHATSHRQPRWTQCDDGYDKQRNCSVGKVFNAHLKQLWYYIQNICGKFRHSPKKEGVMFRKMGCKSNFAQVGIEYTCVQLYMCIQGSPVEIHNVTCWNIISCSIATLSSALWSSSILPPPLCQCAVIPARESSEHIQKCLYLYSFGELFFLNCVSLKLHDWNWLNI